MITDAVMHVWTAPLNPQFHHRTEPTNAEQLLAEMDGAGVDRAVLVPPFEFENDYAVESAQRHEARVRVMPVIDPRPLEASERLTALAARPPVVGFRVVLHKPELARALAAGEFDGFWRRAATEGWRVAVFAPGSATAIGDVARRHPDLELAVDHLGLPLRVTGRRLLLELRPVLELARLPNVAVKVSGLPTHSEMDFPFPDVRAPLEALIGAFGAERVFWGSDLTRLACTYRQAVEMMPEALPDARVRRLVMGEALSRWIGWPESQE